jgi:hypothetical protein
MDEELSVLKSIYVDDLHVTIDPTTTISMTIYANGDENDLDYDKRLLCITFTAELPSTYPEHHSPRLTLTHSRGLTDEQLSHLHGSLAACLDANQGSCVLYECIELIRSKLSNFELPHEACAICLTMIDNRLDVIRTNCHHFYHRACLGAYVRVKKIELEDQYRETIKNGFRLEKDFRHDIEDPVCRQILSYHIIEQLPIDVEHRTNDEKENQQFIDNLSPHVRQWQIKTQALFQQQKDKGGIIDLKRTHETIFG